MQWVCMLPDDYDYFVLVRFALVYSYLFLCSQTCKHVFYRLKTFFQSNACSYGGGPIQMAIHCHAICAVMCTIISFSVHHLTRKSVNTTLEIALFHIFQYLVLLCIKYNFVFEFWSRFSFFFFSSFCLVLLLGTFLPDSHSLHDFPFRN